MKEEEQDAQARHVALAELGARLEEQAALARIVAHSLEEHEQRTADVAREVGAFVEHLLRMLEPAEEKPTDPKG